MAECLTATKETKQKQRGREAESIKTSERRNVRRGRELMFWYLCELG